MFRATLTAALFSLLSASLPPSLAHAAHAPAALQGRPALELASGKEARAAVAISTQTPTTRKASFSKFQHEVGGSWRALWDADTQIPSRIFGSGIAVPGSVADAATASRYARDFLTRQIALLAPGNSASDFVQVSNELHRGVRTIGFKQFHKGIPVVGGQLSFRFKADRLVVVGSEAFPDVRAGGDSRASDSLIRKRAQEWVLKDSAKRARLRSDDGLAILPVVTSSGLRYHLVRSVLVDGEAPTGRWRVYLDAQSGAPIAREQTLRFGSASLNYQVPIRAPSAGRADFPAFDTEITVNGQATTTDSDGSFSWDGTADASVNVSVQGPLIRVDNQAGSSATAAFSAQDGGAVQWFAGGDERLEAQLNAFVHARVAKDFARTLNPDLAWLDSQLPVNVNINDSCNAFSDGNSINFFIESGQCANTARLADVVYHEFGHSLHANSIIEGAGAFDGAFSEGLSDYLAATINDDPAMGIGFFKSDAPLRHIDPDSREHVWPVDVGEVHYTGLIFAGAMWDLRKLFVERLGPQVGADLANRYFYAAVQRSSNIPSTYIEVVLEDDDDGDLTNGTPNLCDINAAFGAHGLRTLEAQPSELSVVSPGAESYPVALKIAGLDGDCPGDRIDSALVEWQLRKDGSVNGEVEMSDSGEGFAAELPKQSDGDVVEYTIRVEFADGSSRYFPDNAADPRYEFYVGEVVELYCTNFESDPFADGWSHGLSAGEEGDGADDWMWGTPQSPSSSGDPLGAYSGEGAVGNDLGGENFNGLYQAQKTNFLLSPEIDLDRYSDVHLQYRRWLNVEDGFFDQASIYANDERIWTNFRSDTDSDASIHHQDREWRFHDVSIINREGKVQLKFEISSDGGLEMGGWTIDDLCVVANVNSICGDGKIGGNEECDEGDANANEPDACRESCLAPTCGDGVVDSGESCDDGNNNDGDGCASDCGKTKSDSGDCGCDVGAQRPFGMQHGLLFGLSLLGLALLRRRRI